MFVTTKVKLAAGLATGALALGAAGAYAANNTITVAKPIPLSLTGAAPATPLSVISVSGSTAPLTLPATFKSQGQCVSFFATNKDLALAPATASSGPLKLSKNYHGKLMAAMTAWCNKQLASQTTSTTDSQTTDTAEVEQSAAPTTDSTDTTNSSDQPSANGLSHSHGQGHGRGHSND